MLSAVESNSHLGSSRAYNVHHHLAYGSGVGVGPSPSITAGTGLNTYPSNVVPAMSAAEFVKPHPKLNRYSSGPSRNGNPSNGGILPPSPVTSSNSKQFKYAAEQPVNLAMGGPSATSSPISSPQAGGGMPPAGMDKLSFADYMYSRHAAAAAAGFLAPQNYPPLMYQTPPGAAAANGMPSFGQQPPSPQQQSMKQLKGDHGSSRMSPPSQMDRNGGGALHLSTEALLNNHRYQQERQQQQQFHHQQQMQQQQQQQKGLKGSSAGAGFMLPPNPSMMPTQAELEAFHAYHQGAVEMNNRLYYNGHGPPPSQATAEHLINAQRLQQQQQQQSPNLPPQSPVSMSRSQQPQQQHQVGKRAIHGGAGGEVPAGAMYHLNHRPQPQQQQQNGDMRGGKGSGGVNQGLQDKNNNIGFKVPSGKEGSLKHRLLTTKGKGKGKQNGSKGARDSNSSSNNNNSSSSYGTSNIIKSNFNKGVLIELGNGELKPVEEMRTEDFILSSNVTPDLEMIDSTILRIMPHGNVIVLTLSNSASKLNIDLTVAPEHPFFVYRQGWASCNPEGTYQMHGLKCQRLEVGDVCISLMQKERSSGGQEPSTNDENIRTASGSSSTSSTSSASSSLSSPPPANQSQQQQQHISHPPPPQQQQQEEPQNLSRKPSPMKTDSRGSIEGTTHHPSFNHNSSPSNAPPTHSTVLDIPQPLHALVHAHLNHAPPPSSSRGHHQNPAQEHQHSLHEHTSSGSNINGSAMFRGQGDGQSPGGGNPLMNSFLSTIKHNYLAAFEAAKAAQAKNEKLNGNNGNGGLSHSIKNIVMGGLENGLQYDPRYPHPYSPNVNGSPGVVSSSSLSPNGSNGGSSSSSSKRRYSAPDNVFGEENNGSRSREGRLEHEEPPKKIASH